jgi:branched-chain amino acid transport system substrate-binding protein
MKRYITIGLAIAVAIGIETTLSAAAVEKSPAARFAGKQPILIGDAGARTGFYTLFDVPTAIGAEIAIKDINAKGGVLGRPLKLIYADSKSDINTGVQGALDLVGKGATMIVPMIGADQGGPAARAAQKKNVISITGSGSPNFGYKGVGPLAYNSYPGTQVEGADAAQFAWDTGWRHPYMLCDIGDTYNVSNCTYFKARWEQLAGKGSVAGYDTYQIKDPTIATQISRLRANTKKDFVYLADYPPQGASAIRQLRAAGITQPILGAAAFDGNYWHSAVPGLSDFYNVTLASIFGDDPNPKITKVFKDYKKIAGAPPATSVYPLIGYTTIEIYAAAVTKAGTTDTAAVAKVLNAFHDQPVLLGGVTFTPTCHIPTGLPMVVMKTTNGKTHYLQKIRAGKVPPAPC